MSTTFNRENMGKVWTREERQQLLELFDSGMPIDQLANAHGRTAGAVLAKLLEHRRLVEGRDGFYYKVSPDPWVHYREVKEAEKGATA
jgi:transposase-like protein